MVQSEQHVIYRLMPGRGSREAQANMEETDKDCYEWKLTTVDPQEGSTL